MATGPAASWFLVLHFLISVQFGSSGETNITAKPGENATLPCRAAENKPVTALEWHRHDLGEHGHVALYRDDRLNYLNPYKLNPAYRDRVDLQDREMKNGDVSLVLRNGNVSLVLRKVTFNDTGTYECRVIQRGVRRRKRSHLKTDPICNVTLDVSAPESNEGQKKDEGTNTGLTVGLPVGLLVLLLLVSGFLLYKKLRRSSQEQNQPPAAEAEPMNVENHQEAQ